ncbi:MAG: Fic family protein [Actinomycetota bacterium]|nr:Fic family protein [Actinomycetota bacterium]
MRVPPEAPAFYALFEEVDSDAMRRIFSSDIKPYQNGKYLHWDELRHRTPPGELSHREWWFGIKFSRVNMAHPLPLKDGDGQAFTYSMPDPVLERVHKIDQRSSGRIEISELVTNPSTRDRYIVSSLMEEAITSSQLEGATTSRLVAREMIASGRAPRDKSEQMIFNNYRAMEFVRHNQREKITPDLISELHTIVTDRTLDDPRDAGRLQSPGEKRVQVISPQDEVLHTPPPAEQLPERMEALCRFANGEESEGFLYPVIRAVIVHFWLAYDHPFVDGNGRTARALFYWCMLRYQYWLAEYLTISKILTNAPAQYGRSFLYTETDSGDTTYFILYNLRVIIRAIEELHQYLQRKMAEVQKIENLIKNKADFNRRQLDLLGHALRTPGAVYTVESHRSTHGITKQTARTDLQKLERRELLLRGALGKAHYFVSPEDLPDRLHNL